MIETLKKIFGRAPRENYAQLVKEGTIIFDVRTKGEYAGGHIKGRLIFPWTS
ncbi:rhodanese-like domain-containing protein [Chryseolinea lacunae]|uniref:rhodanese-like domain-containing protein n=1 Tax=Chryseolinea lacunae TaxID=2801331 RepID=UPI001F1B4D66|nr:rhodanese-like domain-containing protein [Chryseolinea lacunae]